ncbi:MAG: sensor histidine kinase [Muribaculaceae bacterium]
MKRLSTYIDLGFCIVLLPLMIFAFPVERWWATAPTFFCVFVLWLYITYFLYRYFIVPRFLRNRRNVAVAIAGILVSLSITAIVSTYKITSPYYHLRQQYKKTESINVPNWGARPTQQAVWLHYIIVVMFSFSVGMVSEVYRQRLAHKEVELERRKAELALYKAQINPHFLFNTLNTLYGLVLTGSDKTVAMLERFINITKYIYLHADSDYIQLSDEVKYINQYIDLQRLRLFSNVDVDFSHNIIDGRQNVPAMLFITFIENAFKYGVSSVKPCFITISLSQSSEGVISFTAKNLVMREKNDASSGVGIKNCLRRLDLLCPGRYELTYGLNDNKEYEVKLTIRKEALPC